MNLEQLLQTRPPSTELFVTLFRTSGIVQQWMDNHLRRFELSGARLSLLLDLLNQPQPMTSSEFLRTRRVSFANISALLTSLYKQGFISFEENLEDRRKRSVFVTEAGKQQVMLALPSHRQIMQQLQEVLTDEEQVQVHSLLQKWLQGVSQLKKESQHNESSRKKELLSEKQSKKREQRIDKRILRKAARIERKEPKRRKNKGNPDSEWLQNTDTRQLPGGVQ